MPGNLPFATPEDMLRYECDLILASETADDLAKSLARSVLEYLDTVPTRQEVLEAVDSFRNMTTQEFFDGRSEPVVEALEKGLFRSKQPPDGDAPF